MDNMSGDLGTATPSEASKLLEAALLQMDGIIQGTKYDAGAEAANGRGARESSLSGYDNGGRFFHSTGSPDPPVSLSDALAILQEAIVKNHTDPINLSPRDVELAQFIYFWLEQTNAKGPERVDESDQVLLKKEKDSLRLEVSLLHQQLEEKNQHLLQLEQALHDKHSSPEHKAMIMLNSELSQFKAEVERLEKENAELRNLCSGGRVPRYLPLSPQMPQTNPRHRKHPLASSPSDNDASPTTETPPKSKGGFKKIFHKIKRSNSGGHLEAPPSVASPSPRPVINENFTRNGLRATTAGRLGSSNTHSQLASTRRPFPRWTLDMMGIWMDSLGLGCYTQELPHAGIQTGAQLAALSSSELESKLGMKKPLHRKKLALAISSKQEVANANDSQVVDAAGKLDHYWVTRWLDDVGLPQYKEGFLDARVDGRVLNVLTVDDLISELGVTNLLHHLSIKHGIYVLRNHNFDPSYFQRRAVSNEQDDVGLWTNHRVMEWLKQVDLAEYAPNLRGSGVHGALMMNERRFNDELLADLLAIPSNKTLLRRHLSIHFKTLVGTTTIHDKRTAEQDTTLPPLTPSSKAKSKMTKSTSSFTLKRKKSKTHFDYDDLICPFSSRPAMVAR